jgi:hypothetical protein
MLQPGREVGFWPTADLGTSFPILLGRPTPWAAQEPSVRRPRRRWRPMGNRVLPYRDLLMPRAELCRTGSFSPGFVVTGM